MGKEKGGFLTPKAISNRIKAKGLQKLRWFCQMCQKQCRDEVKTKCRCCCFQILNLLVVKLATCVFAEWIQVSYILGISSETVAAIC